MYGTPDLYLNLDHDLNLDFTIDLNLDLNNDLNFVSDLKLDLDINLDLTSGRKMLDNMECLWPRKEREMRRINSEIEKQIKRLVKIQTHGVPQILYFFYLSVYRMTRIFFNLCLTNHPGRTCCISDFMLQVSISV